MANLEELLALIHRQQARIGHLERVLAANNIHVPEGVEVGETTLSDASSHFPALDLSEPEKPPPKRLETKASVEDLPRIMETLLKPRRDGRVVVPRPHLARQAPLARHPAADPAPEGQVGVATARR
jgi:hypothetical protein